MSFLARHLVALLLGTALAIALGAVFWCRQRRIPAAVWAPGTLLIVATTIAACQVVFGPPGQIETTVEPEDGSPAPDTPHVALDRLRAEWDSNAPANWPAAETLASISNLAYLSPIDAQRAFQELAFTEFITVNTNSMIGYVISGEDVTVIVFRGTNPNEISDWIVNFRHTSATTPHGRLHGGFHDTYLEMEPQLEQILIDRPTDHLWITGHSLGGALALVCAYDMVTVKNRTIDGIMTFGQPLVAREDLARHLDQQLEGRYACFVNGNDVIPRIPPDHTLCGSLVWFINGKIERGRTRYTYTTTPADTVTRDAFPVMTADGAMAGLTPLDATEFSELQAKLDRPKQPQTLEYEPEASGEPREYYTVSLPQFDDHYITAYLERIRSHLGIKPAEEAR